FLSQQRFTLFPYTTLFRSRIFGEEVSLMVPRKWLWGAAYQGAENRSRALPLNLEQIELRRRAARRREMLGRELGPRFVEAKLLRSEEHTSELQSLRHLVCR